MSKLRKSARGQSCTLRLPNVCNFNPETVVLAHIVTKGSSGMAMKSPDYMGCFSCSSCHDVIDKRNRQDYLYQDLLRAHLETLRVWVDAGLIEVKK